MGARVLTDPGGPVSFQRLLMGKNRRPGVIVKKVIDLSPIKIIPVKG